MKRTTAFVATATEMVPDIETMQVLYGVDTTGTQTVSEYVTAHQVVDFNSVMSVKIAVLAASPPGAVPKPAGAPTYNLLGNTVTAPADTRVAPGIRDHRLDTQHGRMRSLGHASPAEA